MSRFHDNAVLLDYEKRWLSPDDDDDEYDDDEMWNRADDEAEERWFERRMESERD